MSSSSVSAALNDEVGELTEKLTKLEKQLEEKDKQILDQNKQIKKVHSVWCVDLYVLVYQRVFCFCAT